MDYLSADFDNAGPSKRRLASDAFIKNGAKRKQITAPVHTRSGGLFRRKIEGGTDDYVAARTSSRQSLLVRTSAQVSLLSNLFDQTKIEYLNLSPLSYHHVRRFHITVHYTLMMGFAQCFRDGRHNPHSFRQRQGSCTQFVA